MLSLGLYSLLALGVSAAGLIVRTDTCSAISGPTCTNMYYGQKDSGKQVCISTSDGYLVVNYPSRSCKYSEGHVYIGESPPAGTAPGQFPYTTGNGYCQVSADKLTITCKIPTSNFQCGKQYYIATHSADGCGETGWGNGPCIKDTCNPWAMYWGPFTYSCTCPATSTSSSSSSSTTPPTSVCTSTSTYPPVVSSSQCSTTGYSYSTSTFYSTTTLTATSYSTCTYTTTSSGYCTYSTTPAPSSYTTTCKASY